MKKSVNSFKLIFPSRSCNESFARTAVAAFVTALDPTIEELSDIKTAVSEAVTNCIVHAYKNEIGQIYITARLTEKNELTVSVTDRGCGINDIDLAMLPTYSTDKESERAGLGFSVMEAFMDSVRVRSKPGKGTTVTLKKRISERV